MIVFIGVNAWDIFYSFVQNTLSLNSFLIWLSCLFTLLIFFRNLFHIFISKQTGYFINWQFHKCNYHPFLWYAISSVFQLSFIWLLDPLSVIEQKYIYGVWVPIWVKAFDIFFAFNTLLLIQFGEVYNNAQIVICIHIFKICLSAI